MKKQFITIGILGASAVILGAFGAHSLKNQLATGLISPDQLNGFDTGVKYQMYHTLAMLLLVALGDKLDAKFLKYTWYLFLAGIILFSGSLYFLTTRNILGMEGLTVLGPVTPIGGLCFVLGWISILLGGFKSNKTL
jgi:uncharacterized membrane protein YgdD (TMEM256/DUF423 family)